MSTYGCRHTLTREHTLHPWTLTCMVCLEPIPPFTTIRRCTACQCTMHEGCHRLMVSMTQAAGDIMGREAIQATAAAPASAQPPPSLVRDEEQEGIGSNGVKAAWEETEGAAAAAGGTAETLSNASLATTAITAQTSQAWRSPEQGILAEQADGQMGPQPRAAPQRGPLTDRNAPEPGNAAEKSSANSIANFFASPTSVLNVFATQAASTMSSTRWRQPAPACDAAVANLSSAAASQDADAAQGAVLSHTHALRPTTFLLPAQCACCYVNQSEAARQLAARRATDRSGGAVSLIEADVPTSSWMGLGSEGYECTTCAARLHRVCVNCLDPSAFVLVAPQARTMGDADGRAGGGDDVDGSSGVSECKGEERRETRATGATASQTFPTSFAALSRSGKDAKNAFLAFFGSPTSGPSTTERVGDASPAAPAAANSSSPSAAKAAAVASLLQQFFKGLQGGSGAEAETAPRQGQKDSAASGSATSTAAPASSATWSATKNLITSYLDTSGKNSKDDPNVALILQSIFTLMDTMQARHPDALLALFNPVNMHARSAEDQARYAQLCDELPDADFVLAATGRKVRAEKGERLKLEEESKASAAAVSAAAAAPEEEDVDTRAEGDVTVWETVADSTKKVPGDAAPTEVRPRGEEGKQEGEGSQRAAEKARATTISYLPEVQLMRDALRFAIAVYGETYRQGFLSSLFSSALVFTVSKDDVASRPKELNDAAVTEVLSLPRSSLVLSRWSRKAMEPSYCLLLDHVPQRIVLSFRGTLSDVDILTDVCAFGEPFCGGMAHQGAARTVNRIFARRATKQAEKGEPDTEKEGKEGKPSGDTQEGPGVASSGATSRLSAVANLLTEDDPESADRLLDTLEQLANEYPSYHILVTGHSLGGGMAVLFGVRVAHDHTFPAHMLSRMHVLAFAPMPTLTLPAAAEYDEPLARPSATKESGAVERNEAATPSTARPMAKATANTAAATDKEYAGPMTSGEGESDAAAMATPSSGEDARGDTATASNRFAFPIWSLVNGCDVVPRLQVNSVDRLCRYITGDKAKDKANRTKARGSRGQKCQKGEGAVRESGHEGVEMHDMSNRSSTTDSPLLSSSSREPEEAFTQELYHPGRVFLLTSPCEPQRNRLVEVPRGHAVMHQMFLMRPMLALHMMDNYTEGLRTVRSSLQVAQSAPPQPPV